MAGWWFGLLLADLLTKDYTYDQKFIVSTTTESGLVGKPVFQQT
jgi:hypothetical protein